MLVRFISLVFMGMYILFSNLVLSQFFTEDFESGSGAYTTTTAECNSGADYFALTNDAGIPANFTGSTGDYFAAQDIDGCAGSSPQSIEWTSISISGCTNLSFNIDLAEDDDGASEDWDNADYVHIFYSIDGGAEQNLIWIHNDGSGFNAPPFIDTDFNGVGDGTEITDVFSTFTQAIPGTGTTIDIRIEISLNSGDEDIAFDNLELTGSCGAPNTITTSNVSPLTFNVDCSTDDTGTVDFTSVGTFAAGNNFTAQLSDATGSFASPTNIGSIVLGGTDPSGTINITIPSGTANGTGYRIRVVSDNPNTIGSDNGVDITINLTGGPCFQEPPHMTSLIINSCNTTCGEGDNEVIFGNTGDYSVDMTTSNIEVTYGSNPSPTTTYSNPIVSNSATTSSLNTVTSCPGLFIDAAGTTVPPNSTFMLVNDAFCPNDGLDLANFCGLGPIYVIYTTDANWNSGGNFVNSSSCSGGVRYLTTTITATDGSTYTIDYEFDCTLNSGTDGDYAKWNFNGGAAIEQGNNGCTLDPVVLPVELLFMTVEKDKSNALISWSTASERNNSHFILSHSIDGYNFNPLSTIQGAGTTTQTNYYSDVHFSPIEGVNYYKLQSIDFDGTTYLKGIRAVDFNFGNTYYDYSNNVIHTKSKDDYSIVNLAGQVVKYAENTNQIQFVGTGIYIVQNLITGEAEKLVIH